ncbi:MAG: peptide chain release factor N(5)-glutamine methyltransferase [Bacteroidota bacterium]
MLQNHANIVQIRNYLFGELRKYYSDNESSSILRLILEHAGYPSSVYLHKPNLVPGARTATQIKEIVSEIHTGRPIQYILGYTYFCDLKIRVDESVLIPRPETEEMVLNIQPGFTAGDRLIDLGTGSGCIALALKKIFPETHVTGLDLSMQALALAKKNSKLNQLDVSWIRGDLLDPQLLKTEGSFSLVVSNPPYVLINEKKMMTKNVLDYEPGSALFVKDSDPLVYYRSIAAFSMKKLRPGGIFWAEINERFGRETARLFNKAGFKHVAILRDIHGKERFINGRK